MIIAHLFEREEKRKRKLMLDSSSTPGLIPLADEVEELFVIKPTDSPSKVIEMAKEMLLSRHPELEFADVLRNEKSGRFAFDITFRPRKSLLGKLGIARK